MVVQLALSAMSTLKQNLLSDCCRERAVERELPYGVNTNGLASVVM